MLWCSTAQAWLSTWPGPPGASLPSAQAATLAGNATQGLTFNVYMQTDQGSNNSCLVTVYNSQVQAPLAAHASVCLEEQ